MSQSAYALLGVSRSGSEDEIRAAYKRRALETHPDKGGDPETFRSVRKAYEDILAACTAAALRNTSGPGVGFCSFSSNSPDRAARSRSPRFALGYSLTEDSALPSLPFPRLSL